MKKHSKMISSTMHNFPSSMLLLLVILTANLFLPSHSENCSPHDKKALLQIKKEFGNPTKLSSWDPNTDCCKSAWADVGESTWSGVSCDTDALPYRIAYLVLSDLDLPQPVSIPPSLANLPFLFYLSLSGMPNLVGAIPPSITSLTKLGYLYFNNNSITGTIPNTISQIKSLLFLDLSHNKLTGPLPDTLSSLPNLHGITLNNNKLSGSIPESYGLLSDSLSVLSLSRNRLSGNIPASFSKLNLSVVELSHNSLTGDASVLFGSNKNTGKILLASNSLAFDIGKVGLSASLNFLDLRNNKIYGTLPKELTGLKELRNLNVSHNNLCGEIPQGGHLRRFDEYCYAHNKCLCGSPLPACKT
ncbi:polygalacturonase inhibitor 2-like [Vicia villosa]|uniref:polygalacturonase inhibitor 2-like n=1 Tax=Vicia villosa TaxID=3911 RepID=UPI00273CA85D|nr:polygalacturonase inhibitor 2-like [Vicia villosa]